MPNDNSQFNLSSKHHIRFHRTIENAIKYPLWRLITIFNHLGTYCGWPPEPLRSVLSRNRDHLCRLICLRLCHCKRRPHIRTHHSTNFKMVFSPLLLATHSSGENDSNQIPQEIGLIGYLWESMPSDHLWRRLVQCNGRRKTITLFLNYRKLTSTIDAIRCIGAWCRLSACICRSCRTNVKWTPVGIYFPVSLSSRVGDVWFMNQVDQYVCINRPRNPTKESIALQEFNR